MGLKLGAGDINKLYLGTTEVNKAYLGSTLVYETAVSYLLDIWPGANRAYSFRKLAADRNSAATLVRAVDNAESNIEFDPTTFDGANMWVSGNSIMTTTGETFDVWAQGGDVRILRMLDQSGSSNSASNGTAANQPLFAIAGVIQTFNGKPCVLANVDSGQGFGMGQIYSAAPDYFTMLHAARYERPDQLDCMIWLETASNSNQIKVTSGGQGQIRTHYVVIGGASMDNTQASVNYQFNANRIVFYFADRGGVNPRKGTAWINNSIGYNSSKNPNRTGNNWINGFGRTWMGKHPEMVTWPVDYLADRVAMQDNLNAYLNVY